MMNRKPGEGSYWRRFLLALPVAAALVLTFLFFSPLETALLNGASMKYSITATFLPVMGLTSAVCVLIGAALLAAFRGRAFDILLALCLGVALCLYAQGTFMSGSTPQLSGDDVDWGQLRGKIIVNSVIWIVLLCVPLALRRFREFWRYARVVLPLTLCVMQLMGVVSVALRPGLVSYEGGYMGFDGMCDFSTQGDVLVFMVDRMDYEYTESIREQVPDFFERFDGFTSYDNAISEFAHTRPGMNYMLTGYSDTLYTEPAQDFFYHSWDAGDRHILKDLKEAGFDVGLYGDIRSLLAKNYASFKPSVSNLRLGDGGVDRVKLAAKTALLSAYRSFPLAMARFFRRSTGYYNAVFRDGVMYDGEELKIEAGMENMTVSDEGRRFRFYEVHGAHSPYEYTAEGTLADKRTDAVTQARGSFEILLRIFDRLKAAGVYENATILILADHGYLLSDYEPLDHPTRIAMLYKPAGAAGTPLDHSYAPVSLSNVPATLVKAAGLDYAAYGTPLDEVPDDKSAVRWHIHAIADHDVGWKDCHALYYEVGYDAADMDSWKLVRTDEIQHSLGF